MQVSEHDFVDARAKFAKPSRPAVVKKDAECSSNSSNINSRTTLDEQNGSAASAKFISTTHLGGFDVAAAETLGRSRQNNNDKSSKRAKKAVLTTAASSLRESCALDADANAVLKAVCEQVAEVKTSAARAAELLKAQETERLQRILDDSQGKPWKIREAFDARRELARLQENPDAFVSTAGAKRRHETPVDEFETYKTKKDKKFVAPKYIPAMGVVTPLPLDALQKKHARTLGRQVQHENIETQFQEAFVRAGAAYAASEHSLADTAVGTTNLDTLTQSARSIEPLEPKRLSKLQAEVLDAMLASHGLPLRYVKTLRGDICDECEENEVMTIAPDKSCLECPRCGVTRKLAQATAATGGSANDLDYSSHSSGKPNSRVSDVMEFTQGVNRKEPNAAVVAALMEFLWKRAGILGCDVASTFASTSAAASGSTFASTASTSAAASALALEEACHSTTAADEMEISEKSAKRGQRPRVSSSKKSKEKDLKTFKETQNVASCNQKLEDHAAIIADNYEAHGPYLSALDALERLGSALPCLREHLERISFQFVYKALQAAHEDARNALKNPNPQESGAENENKSANVQTSGVGPTKTVPTTRKELGVFLKHKLTPKDINASYELSAKIGAEIGGFYGVRMASQQREQICLLHGILQKAVERCGSIRAHLPHRFAHEIRQLCILRGMLEFLPLYPLPHPIGSPPLIVLEESLKTVFDELGWEFSPAQKELSEAEARELAGLPMLVPPTPASAPEKKEFDVGEAAPCLMHEEKKSAPFLMHEEKKSKAPRRRAPLRESLAETRRIETILREHNIFVSTVQGQKRYFVALEPFS